MNAAPPQSPREPLHEAPAATAKPDDALVRVLVVEDEPAIAESLAYALSRAHFQPCLAQSLAQAESLWRQASLLVLDLMLPDGDGLELIDRLRGQPGAPPVIVLSSRDGEPDRIRALDRGADDYVTKPFSPREVVARVRAVLRRAEAQAPPPEGLTLSPEARTAAYGSHALCLTRVEFDLLSELATAANRVHTRQSLISAVWGDGFAITDRTVDSHIKSLRRKLAEAGAPALIQTVRGLGFRLESGRQTER